MSGVIMKKIQKELDEFVSLAEKINRQNRERASWLLATESKIREDPPLCPHHFLLNFVNLLDLNLNLVFLKFSFSI